MFKGLEISTVVEPPYTADEDFQREINQLYAQTTELLATAARFSQVSFDSVLKLVWHIEMAFHAEAVMRNDIPSEIHLVSRPDCFDQEVYNHVNMGSIAHEVGHFVTLKDGRGIRARFREAYFREFSGDYKGYFRHTEYLADNFAARVYNPQGILECLRLYSRIYGDKSSKMHPAYSERIYALEKGLYTTELDRVLAARREGSFVTWEDYVINKRSCVALEEEAVKGAAANK